MRRLPYLTQEIVAVYPCCQRVFFLLLNFRRKQQRKNLWHPGLSLS